MASYRYLQTDNDIKVCEFLLLPHFWDNTRNVTVSSSMNIHDCLIMQEKQTKLWHTTYYDNEHKLKQLYIKICKNLPSYSCKMYQVKEMVRGNTKKKVHHTS